MDTLQQPLSGIRVIDLTSVLFGPYATQMLGDFGADVIKVEAPGGDPTRAIGPARNPDMAAGFLGANRNKKSIVLDLKRTAAKDALWRLLEGADVFVHNIRPQKIRALGFSADQVMAKIPNIVYGACHGYLEHGPYAGRPAYDDIIQGESGLAGAFTARDGVPAFVPSVVADKSAGLIAANGLLAALFQRQRNGRGVYMEIGMFESIAAYTLIEHQFGTVFDPPIGEIGYSRLVTAQRKPHRTADAYICMLAYTDAHWRAFWAIAGRPEFLDDARYASISERTKNIETLYAAAAQELLARTTDDWLEVLSAAQIPCGRVNTFADVREDPHLNDIGFFRRFEHPSEGPLEILDVGLRLNGESMPIRQAQPRLGEHGDVVLREAGLSSAEITEALKVS